MISRRLPHKNVKTVFAVPRLEWREGVAEIDIGRLARLENGFGIASCHTASYSAWPGTVFLQDPQSQTGSFLFLFLLFFFSPRQETVVFNLLLSRVIGSWESLGALFSLPSCCLQFSFSLILSFSSNSLLHNLICLFLIQTHLCLHFT